LVYIYVCEGCLRTRLEQLGIMWWFLTSSTVIPMILRMLTDLYLFGVKSKDHQPVSTFIMIVLASIFYMELR
jgi:predicted Fe-S protein YdhL (DUF1289 family)